MSRTFAVVAALTLILAASTASAQMLKTADTPKGKTFVDGKGMTLHTFDKDASGKSMCNGPCAENWPPLLAADDAKPTADMTMVARDDGKKMWAYKGKPLYTFKKDAAPGETNASISSASSSLAIAISPLRRSQRNSRSSGIAEGRRVIPAAMACPPPASSSP